VGVDLDLGAQLGKLAHALQRPRDAGRKADEAAIQEIKKKEDDDDRRDWIAENEPKQSEQRRDFHGLYL